MAKAGSVVLKLRKIAQRNPDVEEGVACAGTALESTSYKTANKAFLFVSSRELRLKLENSGEQAAELAKAEPQRYKVGANGW
ncbi:MAG TPA: hypothetical protein VEJ63_06230 [Planctomycetota bacterium]|nr:hypothetical protein [Planctomycetota bacterium]